MLMRLRSLGPAFCIALMWLACGGDDDDTSTNRAGSGAPAAGSGSGENGGSAAGGDAPLVGTAIAVIAPFGDGTVTGTASFIQHEEELTLVVALNNCPDGAHGVHIHQGTSCADVDAQGGHWDMTRGEGIPNVMCTDGRGTSMIMKLPDDPLAWTIGGPAKTSIVGHVIVVHDAGDPTMRIGCGPITNRASTFMKNRVSESRSATGWALTHGSSERKKAMIE